jgi:DNA primase
MALYPQSFVDDLKHQADIVVVNPGLRLAQEERGQLQGLCPFHGERTPSFQVNRDKGFFHCFGCGAGGDVIKFLQLHEKIGFHDAVKQLAQRFGMTIPEGEQSDEQKASAAEREELLKVHESAAKWFREQLLAPAGARIRRQIADRGISDATSEAMGLGFAPAARTALKEALLKQGYSEGLLTRAGLLVQREEGPSVDRFRNRLMIPIRRDTGSVIAFGGRSVDPDQQPKYLNSPRRRSTRKDGRSTAWISVRRAYVKRDLGSWSRGTSTSARSFRRFPAVASCGTALTPQQVQQLHRFASKVVLSFDPDTAGQGAGGQVV